MSDTTNNGPINKADKILIEDMTEEKLKGMSKDDLVKFVLENKHKLIMNKSKNKPFFDSNGVTHKKEYTDKSGEPKKKKQKKTIDFSKVETIRIALKFSYIGKDYMGLVIQENASMTVEAKIFEALMKCCLIERDAKINKCVYTRCGRTDKGVSALGNVCSLIVRKLP